ncbi:hypothetical protein Y032_0129g1485 [Ancylostoma ceylanicum]|uniref:Uncharacterized protein n=1 Tax=Ancylostoma ceylanicum TaxID=53326 RepID=A0A016T7S3_9BILA|nr:hypothetical protein Y032_0129g1485 [Ancylostoma ceylanicum]
MRSLTSNYACQPVEYIVANVLNLPYFQIYLYKQPAGQLAVAAIVSVRWRIVGFSETSSGTCSTLFTLHPLFHATGVQTALSMEYAEA